MISLRGHFDGQKIILDEPPPAEWKPNTPVEVLPLNARKQARQEMEEFLRELWSRPVTGFTQDQGRTWQREDLYERE